MESLQLPPPRLNSRLPTSHGPSSRVSLLRVPCEFRPHRPCSQDSWDSGAASGPQDLCKGSCAAPPGSLVSPPCVVGCSWQQPWHRLHSARFSHASTYPGAHSPGRQVQPEGLSSLLLGKCQPALSAHGHSRAELSVSGSLSAAPRGPVPGNCSLTDPPCTSPGMLQALVSKRTSQASSLSLLGAPWAVEASFPGPGAGAVSASVPSCSLNRMVITAGTAGPLDRMTRSEAQTCFPKPGTKGPHLGAQSRHLSACATRVRRKPLLTWAAHPWQKAPPTQLSRLPAPRDLRDISNLNHSAQPQVDGIPQT